MKESPVTLNTLFRHLERYKEEVKKFYFGVLFSKYRCPTCAGCLKMVGPSRAICKCGESLDPTEVFQRSSCCDSVVVKKRSHYACGACGRITPSLFLFQERLFDRDYFKEMMAKSRERKRRETRRRYELIQCRSEGLLLTGELVLDRIKGLCEDLDQLCAITNEQCLDGVREGTSEFDMRQYWEHVSALLGERELFLSEICPLMSDTRKDRVWLFITLVFMEHDQVVNLAQWGDDILVARP